MSTEKTNLRQRNVAQLTAELESRKYGVCQCCGCERLVLVAVGTWTGVCWVCLKNATDRLEHPEQQYKS